jgi:putative membrane protein
MRAIAWTVAASAFGIAGCASSPASRRPAPSAPAPIVRQAPVSPATYVAQAASIDLFVIRSSELALVRSRSARIRDVAGRMVVAHQGTSAQLSFAGRRLNLLPSADMLPQHEAMYDELQSSGDFDAAYVRLQRGVHGAALSLHASFAAGGSSATLRPVAANAAAVERSHLEMLRRL